MPKNIDILRNMDSTELADFLATERERMLDNTIFASLNSDIKNNLKIAVRAVIKHWLESEVER